MALVLSSMALVYVFVMILSWCAFKVVYSIWWKPTMIGKQLEKQGFHGPPYKLLYGNIREMKLLNKKNDQPRAMKNSHDISPVLNPFLHNMVANYACMFLELHEIKLILGMMLDAGDKFVTWFGTTPRVTIMDPKLIREIMSNKSGDFLKPRNSFIDLLVTGIASYKGKKWAKHRKIISPAFHIDKLKVLFHVFCRKLLHASFSYSTPKTVAMMPAFSLCMEETITKWEHIVGQAGTCELDVTLEFQKLTGDVISRAAFSSNFQEGKSIFQLLKEQTRIMIQCVFHIQFPFLRFLPTRTNRRIFNIYKQIRSLLRSLIEKREKVITMVGDDSGKDNLLDLLLKSSHAQVEASKNLRSGLTIDDVIEECKLFYFAGQETTENLLTWTLVLLSMHKNWQDRAREEVLQAIGSNIPSFDDLSSLKIVHMILLEVLRLYPPVHAILRCTEKKAQLGDLVIPEGVHIYLPFYLVHRDPKHWGEDALEFNPERFVEGVLKASKDHQTSYFPFGWGPRICIGQNFALLEAKYAIVAILQKFWFDLSPSYVHAPSESPTLRPKFGAQIILNKL
ncbi:Cytochrome P450 [Dillenia turbinata]|uniref:Cytochrome P450 n=1 Tax=Dillenia turbinata TaxID=194707 RepID=A0AAN8UTZ4_9MAGN